MPRIITAPFHPDLECRLADEVRSAKRDDPLRPLAILVPSHQLARRVKWLLAVEEGLTLLDVHVLTFHQLAVKVISDVRPEAMPHAVNPAFREQLLRSLVYRAIPGVDVFRDWTEMHGVWAGVWATIQDLKESGVETSVLMSAIDEGLLGGEDPTRLRAVLHLHDAVLQTDQALGIADESDLAVMAAACAGQSSFLCRMAATYYYGVYDLIQCQVDLFKAVSGASPTTVFFPLVAGNPVYRFAQDFFDRHMQGLNTEEKGTPAEAGSAPLSSGSFVTEMRPQVRADCRFVSTGSLEEQVSVAAKEIRRLIEDQDVNPLDIGVVSRSLDPLLPMIRRVFEENRVPFACAAGEPLIHEPLVKTIAQFIGLRASSFQRGAVMDVLASPFCRLVDRLPRGVIPRPDEWDWITRQLCIASGDAENHGFGDWGRLEHYSGRDIELSDDDDGASARLTISREQVKVLSMLVRELHADLTRIPDLAGWNEYAQAFLDLLPKWFDLTTQNAGKTREQRVQSEIERCLQSVSTLELLGEAVPYLQWYAQVIDVFERSSIPVDDRSTCGVQVLDAMDARGVPFRALFVLNLNEKVFPRSIQEDAFLSDAARDVLARDLGYKMSRKLDGFDEERLLFGLLLRSVSERLYLVYQRADENGRAMIPSGYLMELQRELQGPSADVPDHGHHWTISRRPTERWASLPYDATRLTPQEMALNLLLRAGDHPDIGTALLTCVRQRGMAELLEQGLKVVAMLDGPLPALTPYDGLLGMSHPYWKMVEEKGVSPTSLERYARCPFQYFASNVLRLTPLPKPESVSELEGRTRGMLCHRVLRALYQRLQIAGPQPKVEPDEARAWLNEEATRVFGEFERSESIGYSFLWQLAKEEIMSLTEGLVLADLEECHDSGYFPALFEVETEGVLDLDGFSSRPLAIHGVLDRVDIKKDGEQFHLRVVDYKYTPGKTMRACDKNLALAAIRGLRLQPPLYALMARHLLPDETAVPQSAAFYFLAPHWKEGSLRRTSLDASCWQGQTGRMIAASVRRIVDGLRAGYYAVLPADYCGYCDFAAACRSNHDPTRRRARIDPRMKALKDLRALTLGKEEPSAMDADSSVDRKNGDA
ncbi:MAG: hypothetical protein E6K60_09145 [Nitrospirae bacterium]|nr:MAG: hypothetical protein E6K60_09145 [Nitrospirota bacterium]